MSMNVNAVAKQRVTGLMSGMDTDDIVKKMLSGQQNKLNKANQQRELISWRRDAYRSAINKLTSFQSKFLDVISTSSILRPSNFNTASARITDEAMSKYFTVTGSGTSAGNIMIDDITQLATAQRIDGAFTGNFEPGKIDFNNTANLSGSGTDRWANFFTTNQTLDITVNGETKAVTLNLNRADYMSNTGTAANPVWTWNGDAGFEQFTQDLTSGLNAELASKFGTMPDGSTPKLEVINNGVQANPGQNITHDVDLSLNIGNGNIVSISGGAASALFGQSTVANFADVNRNSIASLGVKPYNNEVKFSINEVVFTFSANTTLKEVMDAVNKSGAGVNMAFSASGNTFSLTSKVTGSADNIRLVDLGIEQTNSDGKIEVIGSGPLADAQIVRSGSVYEIIRGEETLIYNRQGNSLVYARGAADINATGLGRILSADDVEDSMAQTDFLAKLFGGESDANGKITVDPDRMTQGQDAVVEFAGEGRRIFSSNDITVNGIDISLKQTTGTIADGDFVRKADWVPAGAAASADSSRTVEAIKSFIEEYNQLVEELTAMTSERRPRSRGSYYMPLTDEQKGAMNEADIKKWEEEAKKGLLYGDQTISRIVDALRGALMNPVTLADGRSVSLASVGIRSSANFTEDRSGKLIVDEDRLKAAIENDPDMITALFTQQPAASSAQLSDKGAGVRFQEIFTSAINVSVDENRRGSLIRIAGSGGANVFVDNTSILSRQTTQTDTLIERILKRMETDENRYYMQFSKLETALARMSRQAAFFGLDQQQ